MNVEMTVVIRILGCHKAINIPPFIYFSRPEDLIEGRLIILDSFAVSRITRALITSMTVQLKLGQLQSHEKVFISAHKAHEENKERERIMLVKRRSNC